MAKNYKQMIMEEDFDLLMTHESFFKLYYRPFKRDKYKLKIEERMKLLLESIIWFLKNNDFNHVLSLGIWSLEHYTLPISVEDAVEQVVTHYKNAPKLIPIDSHRYLIEGLRNSPVYLYMARIL